jgi:hypothetical protein
LGCGVRSYPLTSFAVPRSLNPLYVEDASLDWALRHIERFGDTDLFPIPFEYAAYKVIWPKVRDFLRQVDVANAEVAANWKMMVPKHTFGFRGATQLGPFDALLYTALIYESAQAIEAFRRPVEERVACAYRLELSGDGRFFGKETGWSNFHGASDELSSTGKYSHVLCADISDFYNQISHHRIQGALAQAGIDENRTLVIERFLGNINARHQSRGIPVGPAVSILLAEACLADVDNFLLQTYYHTRYVDDFRIFCTSERQAVQALHDLSEYLHTAHRLSLQAGKTFIFPSAEFRERELSDPETEERRAREAGVLERMEELRMEHYREWHELDEEEIKEHELEVGREVLKDLLERVIRSRTFPLGSARHVLRRAQSTRSRVILPQLLENLGMFAPVIREVVLYVTKIQNARNRAEIGNALVDFVSTSIYGVVPFIQYWVISALCEVTEFTTMETAVALAEQSHTSIRDRMIALVAKAYGRTDWVRWKKETWANTSAFAQRAIIWASSALPRDERSHWLQPIRNNADPSVGLFADGVFVLYKDLA